MKPNFDVTQITTTSGHTLHIPKRKQFFPQPDITAYELALVLAQCDVALTESLVLPKIARHFKEAGK
jgi:hypothetical protein